VKSSFRRRSSSSLGSPYPSFLTPATSPSVLPHSTTAAPTTSSAPPPHSTSLHRVSEITTTSNVVVDFSPKPTHPVGRVKILVLVLRENDRLNASAQYCTTSANKFQICLRIHRNIQRPGLTNNAVFLACANVKLLVCVTV
jgi:hypothetical protein